MVWFIPNNVLYKKVYIKREDNYEKQPQKLHPREKTAYHIVPVTKLSRAHSFFLSLSPRLYIFKSFPAASNGKQGLQHA
jgi:hypothetical protein